MSEYLETEKIANGPTQIWMTEPFRIRAWWDGFLKSEDKGTDTPRQGVRYKVDFYDAWIALIGKASDGIWEFSAVSKDNDQSPGANFVAVVGPTWVKIKADVGPRPPVAIISGKTTWVINQVSTFNADSSTPGSGSITNYTWHFGDGIDGHGTVVSHTYPLAGKYTLTLAVTNSEGLIGVTTKTITIVSEDQPPVEPPSNDDSNISQIVLVKMSRAPIMVSGGIVFALDDDLFNAELENITKAIGTQQIRNDIKYRNLNG